jgi:hypothetical protein
MVARTVVQSITGATLSISAALPATYDAAGYEASSMVYTAIGEIENYGNHGVSRAVSEFTPVDTAVVAKLPGAKNYGNLALTIGSIPGNAGQIILNSASESNNRYSVKMTYVDGDMHYLDVLVTKFEFQDGAVGSVQKVGVDLAICRKPVIVLAV